MSIAVINKEESIMTDYQFKSIIKMVLAIASSTKDLNKVVEALQDLLPENDQKREEDENSGN